MKIFLSVPFTSRALPDDTLDPDYERQMRFVIRSLTEAGHTVFCALEHANWTFGGLTPPEEELQKDLQEIELCDKMIVYLEERVSSGVQLELGYAYAKGKRIEVYQEGKASWSNAAFVKLSGNTATAITGIDDFAQKAIANNSPAVHS